MYRVIISLILVAKSVAPWKRACSTFRAAVKPRENYGFLGDDACASWPFRLRHQYQVFYHLLPYRKFFSARYGTFGT
jgi:hypothetical protein